MSEPVKTVEIFQKSSSPLTYVAGQTIFQEGETGSVMYGIIEGEVDLIVDGKVVETITTGDVFGEGALVQPKHDRASTAIAKTDCIIASLDRERFLFAIENTPMFAIDVLRSYSNRARRLKRMVAFYLQ
ncbi:cyclic nucleotide-binding domain-containing protein [Mastigocoleus sp. MO_188.B34]|uniref:cyclic nucleotide-binding domain-containing protein n=1 Tax=Mastigocoleus sp. MO_188.B34 TaxID=3036635 RepID=UPI002618B832|nr:cyclic nucleotide-binding domain-containing protein [Mastigocoleus sp. MO_188.B34]MDJ0693425.1 cyclic nucleotide-binding domain-containing protein [Mastigocoleus sp. MO_188.B34]